MTARAATRALVAVDGSDFSLHAARRGLQLLGSDVEPTILFVARASSPALAATENAPLAAVAIEEITEEEIDRARSEVSAAAQSLGVGGKGRVESGVPGPTICAVAERERFDVIVIGSHGAGWMKRLVVGSVSHHVVHHATCPVLVVRDAAHDKH